MVASKKLREKMKEMGITQKEAAEKIGLSQCTVSQKIDNKRPFFLDEACTLADLLGISDDFFSYFFAHDVA